MTIFRIEYDFNGTEVYCVKAQSADAACARAEYLMREEKRGFQADDGSASFFTVRGVVSWHRQDGRYVERETSFKS